MLEDIRELELNKLDAEMEALDKQQKELFEQSNIIESHEPEYKKYSWLQKNITKRKEYKKYSEEYDKQEASYSAELKTNLQKRDDVSSEIKKIDQKKELIKSSKSLQELGIKSITEYQEYCKQNNIEENLETIFTEYPEESRSNKEYMMKVIQLNPFNIRYDETNDTSMYRFAAETLRTYINNQENNSNGQIYSEWLTDMINMFDSEELKSSDSGNRFIEYMKDSLRMINEEGLYIPNVKEAYEMYKTDFGRELDELYQDKECIIGVHGTPYYEEDNKILKDGLRTSSQDERAINNLSRTVAYNIPYLRVLTYNGSQYAGAQGGFNYNYIVKIPKEALEQDSVTPIWGGNSEDLTQDYLLPEYVCGVYDISSKGKSMIRYTGEKTQYDYLYTNCSKQPINNEKKL